MKSINLANYNYADFNIDDFVRWVAKELGRKITIVDLSIPELFGAWISVVEDNLIHDWVFVDSALKGYHRNLVILHELGHIFKGHQTLEITVDQFRNMDAEAIKNSFIAFRRIGRLDSNLENEAESFAREIMAKVMSMQKPKILEERVSNMLKGLGH